MWKAGVEGLNDGQVAEVEALLADRDAAKKVKDYAKADECQDALKALQVCYNDDKKEWYTKESKVLKKTGFKGLGSGKSSTKDLTKQQLRNKRQSKKNKDKAKKAAQKFAATATVNACS